MKSSLPDRQLRKQAQKKAQLRERSLPDRQLRNEFKPNIIPLDQDCEFVGEVVDCIRYVYRAKKKLRKN